MSESNLEKSRSTLAKTATHGRILGKRASDSNSISSARGQASAVGPRMRTPAKSSSDAYVLRRMRFSTCVLAAGLTVSVPLAGCDLFHSDFDVAVGNRTANTVSIFANGGKIGEVGSNLTAT